MDIKETWSKPFPIVEKRKEFKPKNIKHNAKCLDGASHLTFKQLFLSYFTQEMVDFIVECTNYKLKNELTSEEFYKFIAILLYMGLFEDRRIAPIDLWDSKNIKAFYDDNMTRERFKEINANLTTHLPEDGNESEEEIDQDIKRKNQENSEQSEQSEQSEEREEIDTNSIYTKTINDSSYLVVNNDFDFDKIDENMMKGELSVKKLKEKDIEEKEVFYKLDPSGKTSFNKISHLLSLFQNRLVNNPVISPSSEICIDEHICSFRGRVSFRVYMKSKPDRYGIKFWVCLFSFFLFYSCTKIKL